MTRFVNMMAPDRKRAMQHSLRFGNDVLIKIAHGPILWLFSEFNLSDSYYKAIYPI